MRNYIIKRLWQNMASVRDYIVQDCIKKQSSLRLYLQETKEVMTIPADKLEQRMFQAHKTDMISRYNKKQKYQLIDFVWKPD